MSYEIVKHRFALHFTAPEPAPGSTALEHWTLFTLFCASNNVYPRTYDGDVCCADITLQSGPHEWNGNIMLPLAIWEQGYSADGGSMKAFPSRDVTGTGWVTGWQKIARRPIPIALSDGRLAVSMELSLWLSPERAARYVAGECPVPEWDRAHREAWDLLILPLLTTGREWRSSARISLSNVRDLTFAARLLRWKPKDYKGWNDDSFGIFICLPESAATRLEEMQQQVAEPVKPSATRYSPGMTLLLFDKEYHLKEKINQSWIGYREGRPYRIGPKLLKRATIVQPAAA